MTITNFLSGIPILDSSGVISASGYLLMLAALTSTILPSGVNNLITSPVASFSSSS
jgi:hypothetical protein